MPNIRWLLALITNIHRFFYRTTRGVLGHGFGKRKFLLLTNVGRKTGQTRLTPLLYVADGDHWIVVASNAGDERPPAWWLNLQANPETRVRVGRQEFDIRARRADDEEGRRLWPVLEASYSYFPEYRERAQREIPIVVLDRRKPA